MEKNEVTEKLSSITASTVKGTDKYFMQYVVAFTASLLLFSGAISYGWTSPALPLLMNPEISPILITSDESSWIVAIFVIGTVIVPIPAAFMMDFLGRKNTMLLGAIPLIVGWILTGVADSLTVIYAARVLCGFSYGLSYSVLPMYLAEIASDKIRGSITIILTVMAKFGILFSFVVGSYTSFRATAWIGMAPPIVFILLFIWLPDSPYYLIGKNRDKEAIRSLERLRGHKDVLSEYDRMCVAVRKSEDNKGTIREIISRDNLRAVIITIGLAAIQQLCGSQAVIAYAQIIFDSVGSELGGAESSIILAVVQLVTAALSSSIVDKFGRRPLLLFSVLGAAICNTIVGVFFFLDYQGNDVRSLSWLPMTAIMIFIVSYTLGLATVTFVVLGEVFPKNLRAAAGALFTIFASIVGFGVAKMFTLVTDNVGSHATFWIFAGFSYLFVPFIWFLIPETKGKSLDVILEELRIKKASLLLFSGAISYGWTSPALPLLMNPEISPILITSDESSWIVAIFVIGTVIVPIPAAFMMDFLGRKNTMLLGAIPLIVGWILTGVADSLTVIYAARVLCGFSYGLSYSVLPMYLAEIASDKIRGSITIILTVMAKFGILFSFVVGSYTSFRATAWIGMAPPIVFILLFIWLPDSPYYLIGKNRDKEAIRSLERLRGHKDVLSEYDRMCVAVRKSEDNKGTIREIISRDNLRAVIITIGLAAIQQLCGSQAVIAYAQIIFDSVGSELGGAESSIILAVVQLVTAALSSSIVDKFGRRPLLLFSVLGAAICNTIVGVFFFLDYQGNDVRSLSWLPMTAIMIFIVSYTLGLATVTFVVLGEVFPKNLRAAAGALFTIFASIVGFGVAKMFTLVTDNVGSHATFWIFAGFSYLFVPFIWFLIPETKGKSLDVILEELRIKKGKMVKS